MIRIVFLAVTLLITVLACAIASPWNPAQMLLGGGGASTPTSTGPTLSTFDISRNSTSPPLTFANTNLTATSHVSYSTAFTTLFHNSGTFYFRFVLGSSCGASCGVGMATASLTNANYVGDSGNQSFGIYNGELWINGADTGRNTGVTMGANAVVDLVVNLDSQTVRMAVNGGALGSAISIGGLASYNLSPAWTGDAGESVTFVGGPPSAYGVTQWDGGAAPQTPQTPVAVSFNQGSHVSVSDTTTSGTTISGISVSTSNGAAFAGTLSINSNGGSQSNTTFCPGNTALTNISSTSLPSNVRANCNFSAALDNASPTVTVAATENGTTVTGTLTMSVYNPGAGVACDIGPNTPLPTNGVLSSIGFDHCFLNADFSQNVTTNGVNFTNPNTWLFECSGAPVGGTGITGSTTFFLLWFVNQQRSVPYLAQNPDNGIYYSNTVPDGGTRIIAAAPCDRGQVITDPEKGGTAFDWNLRLSDCAPITVAVDARSNPSGFTRECSGADNIRLFWPDTDWGAGDVPPGTPGFPMGGPYATSADGLSGGATQWAYWEYTFRIPTASFDVVAGDSSMLDIYPNGAGGNDLGQTVEIDFFETHGGYDGTTIPIVGLGSCLNGSAVVVGGTQTWTSGGCARIDVHNYHKYGFLDTWDSANSDERQCFFIDDVKQLDPCPNMKSIFPDKAYSESVAGAHISAWNSAQSCFGDGFGCTNGDFHIYIRSIRVFSCVDFWNPRTSDFYSQINAGCTSVSYGASADDKPKTRFALLMEKVTGIWAYISRWLVGSAVADEPKGVPPTGFMWQQGHLSPPTGFMWQGHLGGQWICPDGKVGNKWCMPKEFARGEWWKECLPNHPDCVWSEGVINGVRNDGRELGYSEPRYYVRGPGYCYKSQPYTCSPSGKVPE